MSDVLKRCCIHKQLEPDSRTAALSTCASDEAIRVPTELPSSIDEETLSGRVGSTMCNELHKPLQQGSQDLVHAPRPQLSWAAVAHPDR
jgi:hypothetical protein